jgi:hypothetical protein
MRGYDVRVDERVIEGLLAMASPNTVSLVQDFVGFTGPERSPQITPV